MQGKREKGEMIMEIKKMFEDGNMIVSDNNHIVGSIAHLQMLFDFAACRSRKLGFPFRKEEYKWILGIKILEELKMKTCELTVEIPEGPMTLFGIAVEIDHENPNNIQLWEDITNKI